MEFPARGLLCVFLFLGLFFSFASAVDIDPKQVGRGVFDVALTWDFNLNGQNPSSLRFTTFNFFDDSSQDVELRANRPYSEKIDNFGNRIMEFTLDPTLQRQQLTITAKVYSNPGELGEAAGGDLQVFKEQSELVAITPAISAKAIEITRGEVNPLKKAALLTAWVHNNVEYDLGYKDSILSSGEVFDLRKGVCNEFSHLLIAMLRSQGIPARFVAGYVYSGEVWAPHAWIEVAVSGKWFPFDPTYNEGIVLDATHLKFAQGIDQKDVREQLIAIGNVDLSRVLITRSQVISIQSSDAFSQLQPIQLETPLETVPAGSISRINATVVNSWQNPVAFPLSLSVPEEVKVLTARNALVFLFSGESASFYWDVLVPAGLQPGFLYTYPVVVRSLGGVNESTIQAKKEGELQEFESIRIRDVRLTAGQSVLIATVQNSGNTNLENSNIYLEISGFNSTRVFSLEAGESLNIAFPLPELNFSTALNGTFILNSTQLSLVQMFSLEPAVQPEPSRPAFSIETARQSAQGAGQGYSNKFNVPFGGFEPAYLAVAAIVLILLVLIISRLHVRS